MMQFSNQPKPQAVLERYARMKTKSVQAAWNGGHPHRALQMAGACVSTLTRHGHSKSPERHALANMLVQYHDLQLSAPLSHAVKAHAALFVADYDFAIVNFAVSALKYSLLEDSPESAFKYTFVSACLANANGKPSAAVRETELGEMFAIYARLVTDRPLEKLLRPVSSISAVPIKWILESDKQNYMISLAGSLLSMQPFETYSPQAAELLSKSVLASAGRMYQEDNLVTASALCYDSIQLAPLAGKPAPIALFKKIAMKIQEKTALAFGMDPAAWQPAIDKVSKTISTVKAFSFLDSQDPEKN
ncbi:MAG: hypothetical protein M1530_03585 [Candidatus Marsarchaeota archaeon]|nr:hypothetical protein [Candidatus Marsarchaeota archaeon]